jgi:uncharacterized protein (TIGR04255 family)
MKDRLPKPHPLPNKPLVEAILEIRWAIQPQADGEGIDPGFSIFLGRFYDKVSSEFPESENLPAAMMPEQITPYVVRNRFRKTKGGWPLVQVGPGILSANDTEGYDWSTFRPMLRRTIEVLFEAYPQKIAPLKLSQATLRYVNAVPLNVTEEKKPVLEFLKDHLHTHISIDSLLFDDPTLATKAENATLRLNFQLDKPKAIGVVAFSTGVHKNVRSIIWENMVVSREEVPQSVQDFDTWIEQAHTITDRWFFTLSRGLLLEKFGGRNDA